MPVGVGHRPAVGRRGRPHAALVGIDARIVVPVERAGEVLPAAHVVVHLDAGLRVVKPGIGVVTRPGVVNGQGRLGLVVLVIELKNLRTDLADAAGGNLVVDEHATEGGRAVGERVDDGALVDGIAAVIHGRRAAIGQHGHAGRKHGAQIGVRGHVSARIETHHGVGGNGARVGAEVPHRLHIALEGDEVKQLIFFDGAAVAATPVGKRVTLVQIGRSIGRVGDGGKVIRCADGIEIRGVQKAEERAVHLICA